jgi:hypothetical protein
MFNEDGSRGIAEVAASFFFWLGKYTLVSKICDKDL